MQRLATHGCVVCSVWRLSILTRSPCSSRLISQRRQTLRAVSLPSYLRRYLYSDDRENMAFTLPIFNLTCHIWHAQAPGAPNTPFVPPGAPPDLTPTCQLYVYSKPFTPPVGQDFCEGGTEGVTYPFCVILRVPKGTDIRAPWNRAVPGGQRDLVECPAGSGRFYWVATVEDVHKGFGNEYRVGALEQYGYTGGFPIT